ncbi:hypothetical protein GGI24_002081 [Coemansia furcata]|nr:hypothetical protein GGI24_002081 [Coemansia furcata]
MASNGNGRVTTNLYIGNLPLQVDEQALCLAFAKYGPIASSKSMWPSTPKEHSRSHNRVFLSYMDCRCAAKAIRTMTGMEFHGGILRIAWGKRVPIPAILVFVLNDSDPQKLLQTDCSFNAK